MTSYFRYAREKGLIVRKTLSVSALIALALTAALSAAVPANATRANALAATTAAAPLSEALFGVSCVTAKYCVAVGAAQSAPLALIWNGVKWRKVAVKLPSGSAVMLDSVSCASTTYCVALGPLGTVPPTRPFAAIWNGRAWTSAVLPKPSGAVVFSMAAVSCVKARDCVAVGQYNLAKGSVQPVVETLAGAKWLLRRLPLPKGAIGASLAAVSCLPTAFCALGGQYFTTTRAIPLFESWNGKAFAQMKASATASFPSISGVSCVSAKSCVAVAVFIGGTATGFTEVWNGRAWSVVTVRWPKGTRDSILNGVSCAAGKCVAAGELVTPTSDRAATLSYNGKAWAMTNFPAPARGDVSLLSGVSCAGTACFAVGNSGPASGPQSAALTGFWNGKSWKVVAAP
jgi:hypothetical protein